MVNLQSSINELQKDYNRNYAALEGLERDYGNNKLGKKNHRNELEVRYKIERRKLKIRNKIIQHSIKALKDEQQQVQKLSNKYEINYKLETCKDEELNHHVEQLQEDLIRKYKDLDSSIIKEMLEREEYLKIHTKPAIICASILHGGVASIILGMLFVTFNPMEASIFVLTGMRIGLGISFVFSSTMSAIVMHQKNEEIRNLFQKLRKEYKQKNQLSCDICQVQDCNQIVNQITKIELELQEQKRILEIKEQFCANKENNETQSMQRKTQERTISQYGMYEDYGKQKCMQYENRVIQ